MDKSRPVCVFTVTTSAILVTDRRGSKSKLCMITYSLREKARNRMRRGKRSKHEEEMKLDGRCGKE